MTTYTVEHARKVLAVVDAGLVSGLGSPEPGKMCVEAAICYALGLPHGDDPQCVEPAVRAFKIALNDKAWSSPAARAQGLRALAVAQLGSRGVIDGRVFAAKLAEATIRVIVPIAVRAAARRVPSHAERLEAAAKRCEEEGTRGAAYAAASAASAAAAYASADAAAYRAAADAAYASAAAAAYRADAAYRAAACAADAAYAADAYADAAYAAAAYAAAAYASADAAADAAAPASRDRVLATSAGLALAILRELGAPGVALWDAVTP